LDAARYYLTQRSILALDYLQGSSPMQTELPLPIALLKLLITIVLILTRLWICGHWEVSIILL